MILFTTASLLLLLSFNLVFQIEGISWVPEPRLEEWWLSRHNSFRNNTRTNKEKINVIFYGDSITEGWGVAGNSVFQEKYASLGIANYGIWDDRTEHLLYRIADGEVKDLKPKLVVLKIGTNNAEDGTDDVARGIRAVLDLLLEKVPSAKILLLGILPRNNMYWFGRVCDVNIKISKFADGEKVFFLNMFDQFSSSWGQVDIALYRADLLHLETAGYRMWAETMDHLFNELLISE